MNMMPAPKRNSFLAIVYIGLAMEGYFETKGVPVKFKNPLSRDEFTRLYGSTIRGLFNQLWGTNLDVITEARVFEAMRGFDQNILDQVQRNIEVFGNTVYKPGMAQVIGKGADPVIEAINNISDASMFFDITHPSVTDWLNNHTAEKIVGKLIETQGAAIKGVIRMSVDQKLGFLQTKEMLKSGMILTERQTGWVTNRYNKAYDKFLERYSWDGMPNAAGRARDAASLSAARWRKHYLDYRNETITRTEATRAHNVAERAGLMQAEENGYIKNVRRTWRRTSSINNHESSLTNDGVTVGLRERFPSGAEFPDEINEQCILENSFEMIKKPGRPGKPIGQIPGVGKPKPKPKRKPKPKLVTPKTIKEAEEWALRNNIADKVDWTGIDSDGLMKVNEFQKNLYDTLQKYPVLRPHFKYIGTLEGRINLMKKSNLPKDLKEKLIKKWALPEVGEAIAHTEMDIEGFTGIAFNQYFLNDPARFNILKLWVDSGWSAHGLETFKGTIDHETMHVIDGAFKITKSNAAVNKYLDGLTYEDIAENLSQYATGIKEETLAEAWAEFLNNPKPRKIARNIGEMILSILGAGK